MEESEEEFAAGRLRTAQASARKAAKRASEIAKNSKQSMERTRGMWATLKETPNVTKITLDSAAMNYKEALQSFGEVHKCLETVDSQTDIALRVEEAAEAELAAEFANKAMESVDDMRKHAERLSAMERDMKGSLDLVIDATDAGEEEWVASDDGEVEESGESEENPEEEEEEEEGGDDNEGGDADAMEKEKAKKVLSASELPEGVESLILDSNFVDTMWDNVSSADPFTTSVSCE